jgi:hypothetical protein
LKVHKQKRAQTQLELDRGKTNIEVQTQLNDIYPTLSAWTEITHTYYDGLFFHHISLKILAISTDMPVLFASSGKKIVFLKYGTYLCPSTY